MNMGYEGMTNSYALLSTNSRILYRPLRVALIYDEGLQMFNLSVLLDLVINLEWERS
jgi:hypothetical protein